MNRIKLFLLLFASTSFWALCAGMQMREKIEEKNASLEWYLCNYCGDEDPSTSWTGHEPGCPDSMISPQLMIDSIPVCEAR